jgi:hypothetical protein
MGIHMRQILQLLVLCFSFQTANAQVTEFFYQPKKDVTLLRTGIDVQMSKTKVASTTVEDFTKARVFGEYSYGLTDRLSLGVLVPYVYLDDSVSHEVKKGLSDLVLQLKAFCEHGNFIFRYGANFNWSLGQANSHVNYTGNQSLSPYLGMDYHPSENVTFGGSVSYDLSLDDRKYVDDTGILQKSQIGGTTTANLFYEQLVHVGAKSARIGAALSHALLGDVREFDGARTERLSQTSLRIYTPYYLKDDLSQTIIPTVQYTTSIDSKVNGGSVDSASSIYVGVAFRMNIPSADSFSDDNN